MLCWSSREEIPHVQGKRNPSKMVGIARGIMIKGSIQEEVITIVNIYAPNIGAPQYIRQTVTDIKGETNSNTIVGDFNTL